MAVELFGALQSSYVLEEAAAGSGGHKKMRVAEPVARLQRKTPLKQRRSYFDSAEYYLQKQGLQPCDTPPAPAAPSSDPSTPPQPLPMKLQPCQHVAQPSRLRTSS